MSINSITDAAVQRREIAARNKSGNKIVDMKLTDDEIMRLSRWNFFTEAEFNTINEALACLATNRWPTQVKDEDEKSKVMLNEMNWVKNCRIKLKEAIENNER